jgi:hypothetical protein
MQIPKGAKISARVDMDPDGPDFVVFETTPEEAPREEGAGGNPFSPGEWWHVPAEDADSRDETLAVVDDSVVVHIVQAVQVQTQSSAVKRYRTTERRMPGDAVGVESLDDIDF